MKHSDSTNTYWNRKLKREKILNPWSLQATDNFLSDRMSVQWFHTVTVAGKDRISWAYKHKHIKV